MGRLWFLLTIGLIGTGILVSLGVWQVQRLAWKQDMLARIDAQISAAPVSLTEALEPTFRRYAPVEVTGQFGPTHIRMLASRKTTGAVYRIIRPFVTDAGASILIDTGWQPQSRDVSGAPQVRLTRTGAWRLRVLLWSAHRRRAPAEGWSRQRKGSVSNRRKAAQESHRGPKMSVHDGTLR